MDDPELRRVPDVSRAAGSERARARRASPAPARAFPVQHGHGRERRGHDDPHLWQRSAESSDYEHGRNDPLPLSGACRLRSFQLPGAAASGRCSGSCSPRSRWPAAAARSGSSRRPPPGPRRSPAEARSTVRSPASTTTSAASAPIIWPVQVLSPTKLQVGAAPAGPTVVFTPTAGAAQAQQIDGNAQGAEVIGPALMYPNQGSTRGVEPDRGLPGAGRAGIGAH